jgi:ribonuclease P protein component
MNASTRHFKKAVHRNRIKRLLREAYRLQKYPLQQLMEQQQQQVILFFIYTDKTLPEYELIYEKMSLALNRLMKEPAIINTSKTREEGKQGEIKA